MEVWLEGDKLDDHIMNYFQSIFSTNTTKGPLEFLSNMGKRVIDAMNVELTHEFTREKINEVLR